MKLAEKIISHLNSVNEMGFPRGKAVDKLDGNLAKQAVIHIIMIKFVGGGNR